MRTTITEALADIKTTQKRITAKREAVQRYLFRQDFVKDPLSKEGGSEEFIRREEQGVADLERHLVALRTAIQSANLTTSLTVMETTKTVAEWLTWRKEVAPNRRAYLRDVIGRIQAARNEAVRKGVGVAAPGQVAATPNDLIVSVDEGALNAQVEAIDEMLSTLDGKLSLLNATTFVEA